MDSFDNDRLLMHNLIQQKDWSATSLGSISQWSPSLKTALNLCLFSHFSSVLFWGPEHLLIYNDNYSLLVGNKHPQALGQPAKECLAEVWDKIGPMMSQLYETRRPVWVEDAQFSLERSGFLEEAYFTFCFTPIFNEKNEIEGIFDTVVETTKKTLAHRRLALLHELGKQAPTENMKEICEKAAHIFEKYPYDLPFTLFYLLDDESPLATLCGKTGIGNDHPACHFTLSLNKHDPWDMQEILSTNKIKVISDLTQRFDDFPGGPWPEKTWQAMIIPINNLEQRPFGFFIAGISPRLALNQEYHDFLQLIAQQFSRSFAITQAYEQQQKRAEKLMELDQVKTIFFNNVSHEFRTPLTLLLGPIENALAQSPAVLQDKNLEAVHRNALRLLRLVNSLLDFAKIESNRTAMQFVPVDLSQFTIDLASTFRSLIERAGLTFTVDCPPLTELIYVDVLQWEKIILNLLSNAFKFTLQGEIKISLKLIDTHVELRVKDSGCGIPQKELPCMFERFHRVAGAKGRSFEGTGIGLALVHDLVKLHGGKIDLYSIENQGTTFIISIPRGVAHLPTGLITDNKEYTTNPEKTSQIVKEASHWLEVNENDTPPNDKPTLLPANQAHILIADDNADMRHYLQSILSNYCQLTVTNDGKKALEAALANPPDLVLSDIMMPNMNGIDLLRSLRANRDTRNIPVIFLSARAGEESLLEGIETGADDYLTKPFSARELLARIQTHLNMAHLRQEWSNELEQVNKELEAFSYSVSHDLRTPLRGIDGFSKILLQDYSQILNEEGKSYLQRICTATKRMSMLIDDLINLARITRMPVQRTLVNLSHLANAILNDLISKDPHRPVEVHVHNDLMVKSDARLLEVILENLLNNAWKFTSKQSKTKIEVGKLLNEKKDNQTIFFIQDNGAGFNMEYAAKIFTPFQRFHSNSEFEGTGIGLATVHRIIKKHTGCIWVETNEGQGAKFFFTLGD